ncbi:MAG: hypothetical protein AAFS07_19495, partial [Pseudomonadota bacterium]
APTELLHEKTVVGSRVLRHGDLISPAPWLLLRVVHLEQHLATLRAGGEAGEGWAADHGYEDMFAGHWLDLVERLQASGQALRASDEARRQGLARAGMRLCALTLEANSLAALMGRDFALEPVLRPLPADRPRDSRAEPPGSRSRSAVGCSHWLWVAVESTDPQVPGAFWPVDK